MLGGKQRLTTTSTSTLRASTTTRGDLPPNLWPYGRLGIIQYILKLKLSKVKLKKCEEITGLN